MNKYQVKRQAQYWFLSSKHDYDTMLGLFQIKRYSDALFYGHLVIEKILKALFVANNKKHSPLIHDLVALYKITVSEILPDEINFLKTVNSFNIRSRYPDYKFNFYKKCDFDYTNFYLIKIKFFYHNLCLNPKLKKLLSDLPLN